MSFLAFTWLMVASTSSSASMAPPADETLTRAMTEIQTRCYECHADKNVKGGLRLDDVLGWRKIVDTVSPEDSELLYRLRLPADDGDAMPPEGDRVSSETIERIQRWIEAGADTAPVQERINEVLSRSIRREALLATTVLATGAVIEPVRPSGGGESGLVRVSWSHSPAVPTQEQIALVFPIAERVLELSLAGTEVTDELLTKLPMLPALRRAHLERTNLTDAGVATLIERAPGLRYLNVHSTRVSPSLHDIVRPLEDLEELVTFNTEADRTERAAPFAALRGQQPRRILAIAAGTGKAVLLREAGLGSHELLWERSPGDSNHSYDVIQWLGDSARPKGSRSTGVDDGHGGVLMQDGPGHLIEVDTRTNRVIWERRLGGRILGFTRDIETGATLILASSGGDSRYLVEIDTAGAARTRPVAEFPVLALTNERRAQRLASGHSVRVQPGVTPMPAGDPAEDLPPAPQLIETDPKREEVIWTFHDHQRFPEGLSAAQVIARTPQQPVEKQR